VSLNLNSDTIWQKFQNPGTKLQTLSALNSGPDVLKKSDEI